MNIGILGTGAVGRAHAEKLIKLGHDVMLGTRETKDKLADTKPDILMGNEPFMEWHKENWTVKVGVFADAAAHGEVVFNCLKGEVVLEVLASIADHLQGKILIDISNPIDFSSGRPPALAVCNTDSLGEQIQRALPTVKVIKTLNTITALLQVDPKQLAGGNHHVFLSGNDVDAKREVTKILKEWYGWEHIIDLGDISTARGAEMFLPLWLRIWESLKNTKFGIKIVTE